VPETSTANERSCICVLRVLILLLSTIILLDVGTVPTGWYVLFFILLRIIVLSGF
jgi:hypothetical protein